MRFDPLLSAASTAKAGKPLTVPLAIDGPAVDIGVKSLAVWVSYDDGITWTTAPVDVAKSGRSVTLHHPKGAKTVALRTALSDTRGNTMNQSVMSAYTLTP
ncbi:hypothetical protein [Streptomyces sp. NPDC057675]|uniref:hypothetical protein n=1 Tax=Streptomyces sp. NPDC057675 TaxID=3346204 RepID=UPI00369A99EC